MKLLHYRMGVQMTRLIIKETPGIELERIEVSRKRLIEMSTIAIVTFKNENRREYGIWHLTTEKGKLLVSGMSNRLVAVPVTSFLDKKFIRFKRIDWYQHIKRDFRFRIELVGPIHNFEGPIIDYHYENKCTSANSDSK